MEITSFNLVNILLLSLTNGDLAMENIILIMLSILNKFNKFRNDLCTKKNLLPLTLFEQPFKIVIMDILFWIAQGSTSRD